MCLTLIISLGLFKTSVQYSLCISHTLFLQRENQIGLVIWLSIQESRLIHWNSVQWVTPVCDVHHKIRLITGSSSQITWHVTILWCITRQGVFSAMATLAFTSRITAWIAITGNYCSLAVWRLAGSPSHQISMSILLFKLAPRLYQVAQSVNESNPRAWLFNCDCEHMKQYKHI